MDNIVNVLMIAVMAILGGIPSLYILISMPVILVQKVYGKVKYGRSLYD